MRAETGLPHRSQRRERKRSTASSALALPPASLLRGRGRYRCRSSPPPWYRTKESSPFDLRWQDALRQLLDQSRTEAGLLAEQIREDGPEHVSKVKLPRVGLPDHFARNQRSIRELDQFACSLRDGHSGCAGELPAGPPSVRGGEHGPKQSEFGGTAEDGIQRIVEPHVSYQRHMTQSDYITLTAASVGLVTKMRRRRVWRRVLFGRFRSPRRT